MVELQGRRTVITSGGAASMAAAALVSALSGYVVLMIVAHRLTPAQNADFLVFWSLLFAVIAVLGGLQQEATRAVGTAELAAAAGRPPWGVHVLPIGLAIGSALAVVVAVLSPLWRPALLGPDGGWGVVAVLCLAAAFYSGHLTVVGNLAGERRWSTSATLIGGESTLRLLLVGVAALASAGLAGLELAAAASTVCWLVMLPLSRNLRRATHARGDVPVYLLVPRVFQTMLAAVGSAALVVGFPTILRLSSNVTEWATAAPLVLAISLTRAPLLIPLTAFQGVAIAAFLDPGRKRLVALLRLVGGIAGIGVLGAVLAAGFGPWLMAAFFGPDYRVSGVVLAGLTLDAIALAVLTMTGAGVLALARHWVYATGWLTAAAVSLGVLFLPLSLTNRSVVSLAVGPLVGIAVHVVGMMADRRANAENRAAS